MSQTLFRYFRQPHEFSTYSQESQVCDICSKNQGGYKGPFFGKNPVKFICEECLISGKLAEIGSFTNEGDLQTLTQQIHNKQPELTAPEVERLAKIRDDELRNRTPHVITWQGFSWPVHCGDYCCFIKEAGKPEIVEIVPENIRQLIFHFRNAKEFKIWWKGVRSDSPKNCLLSYSIGVYLFQCLNCQEYVFLWDCD